MAFWLTFALLLLTARGLRAIGATLLRDLRVEAPGDSQAPAAGCHCLCHMAAQAIGAPIVTPILFNESLFPPRGSVPPRSCAGLPPFRPPRA